jgi:hypothetical protein
MKPVYKHTENGTTICTLRDKSNNVVYGYAYCHPEDEYSERIGDYVATIRAEIKYYKLISKIELEPQIKTLRHLLSCFKNTGSKIYNPECPEVKLIERQLHMAIEDRESIRELTKELKKALNEYLENREKLIGQIKAVE